MRRVVGATVALISLVFVGFVCGMAARYDSAQTTRVPGIVESQCFSPSDAPPKCLPNGTVTYEIYDSAAHMRYWVFRWPEGGGYSVVPRYAVEDGQIVPYEPFKEEQ